MRRSNIVSLLAALLLSLGVGCNPKAPAECQRVCSLSVERQHQTFKSLPVEKQFELYVGCDDVKACWRDSVSPQDDFGRWLAEDAKAAPFLTERLKAESVEGVRRDIIRVLRLMAVNGRLRGQRRIAEAVNHAVAGMDGEDEVIAEQSRTWAREIEANTR